MTTPAPAVTGTPVDVKNTKAWIATIGSLLISQGPLILQFLGYLPPPYGLIATGIGSVLAAITGRSTWKVPNVPTGTVPILPHPTPATDPPAGGYKSTWK